MYTYFIFYENQLKKVFKDQCSDQNIFGWLLRHQSNSVHRALTVDGWSVEVKDQNTGTVTKYGYHRHGIEIADPLCNKLTQEQINSIHKL